MSQDRDWTAFRLGLLWVRVEGAGSLERQDILEGILAIFRARPEPWPAAGSEESLVIRLRKDPNGAGAGEMAPDQLIEKGPFPDGSLLLQTEALSVCLRPGLNSVAEVFLKEPRLAPDNLRVHLSVLLHRILFRMDRMFLHAGGILIDGGAIALVGDKGAGKSTLSLRLGAAGATVLADDHLVVRWTRGGVLVSGCDETARLLPDAETHLFGGEIDAPLIELGGVRKKEVRVDRFFEADPFREHRLERLIFQRIGTRLTLERMSGQRALLELIAATRRSHRFPRPSDHAVYLDRLLALAEATPAFSLELTPRLADLDGAAELLLHV